METTFLISCPKCGKKMRVRQEHAGKKTRCPASTCQEMIAIPSAGQFVEPVSAPKAPAPSLFPPKTPVGHGRGTGSRPSRILPWVVAFAVALGCCSLPMVYMWASKSNQPPGANDENLQQQLVALTTELQKLKSEKVHVVERPLLPDPAELERQEAERLKQKLEAERLKQQMEREKQEAEQLRLQFEKEKQEAERVKKQLQAEQAAQQAAQREAEEKQRRQEDLATRGLDWVEKLMEQKAREQATTGLTGGLNNVELVERASLDVEARSDSRLVAAGTYYVSLRGSIIGVNRYLVTVRIRAEVLRASDGTLTRNILGSTLLSKVKKK